MDGIDSREYIITMGTEPWQNSPSAKISIVTDRRAICSNMARGGDEA